MQTVPVHVKVNTKQKQEKKRVCRVICKIGLHIICLVLPSTILLLVHSYQIDRTEANAYISGYKAGCNKGFPEGYDLGNSHGFDLGYDSGTKDALNGNTTGKKSIDAIRAKYGLSDTASDFLVEMTYGSGDNSSEQNQALAQLLDTANEPFDLSFWDWLSQKISKTGE